MWELVDLIGGPRTFACRLVTSIPIIANYPGLCESRKDGEGFACLRFAFSACGLPKSSPCKPTKGG